MTPPLLAIRGLRAAYGKIEALKGVDLDISPGEIVALIGANGAGKSTLMMTIFGQPRYHGCADPRNRAAAHRAIAGRPPDFSADERGGKPADGRRRHRFERY
jgi:ABC-type branched-subunit amino acid transport system ATPase component